MLGSPPWVRLRASAAKRCARVLPSIASSCSWLGMITRFGGTGSGMGRPRYLQQVSARLVGHGTSFKVAFGCTASGRRHCPVQLGLRFSTNALTPSRKSSLP